ncbi:MAG: integration host factor subunit beta [Candidatus Mcinerneyibacterium aminivorans]|jgi:integration host factor subunit beta|uniref:Integration host factor subunit beta n=1 Tax=Candidatus Mcinerneyibacterium aminivorans TaxID=2703815 RepID=A0A5D0MKJ8_9BACT|nr:MAG: integration host factor subunit beta [Candidatus Mcinerneyibacterium aminivorans]
MTKNDLTEKIWEKYECLTKQESKEIINLLMEEIKKAVENEDSVELRGFGTFKTKTRKARTARNPHTGEKIKVPRKQVPYFKPSPKFKTRVNGNDQ